MDTRLVTREEIDAAGLGDWRTEGATLRSRWRTGDFTTGLALVNLVGEAAEAADHHPDIVLRYGAVEIVLWSHDAGGVTTRDLSLARTISALAAQLGAEADAGGA